VYQGVALRLDSESKPKQITISRVDVIELENSMEFEEMMAEGIIGWSRRLSVEKTEKPPLSNQVASVTYYDERHKAS